MLARPPSQQTLRFSSTTVSQAQRLTHISKKDGKPTMVSITDKPSTSRSATASGRVRIPKVAYELLSNSADGASGTKGNVLAVAQLAGIMAAKKTSDLIPLCHPISLTNVDVQLALRTTTSEATALEQGAIYYITVEAKAEVNGATGVEMEALTAVNVACLTIWDMLKAVAGKDMVIEDVKVTKKSGGKSGDWIRQ